MAYGNWADFGLCSILTVALWSVDMKKEFTEVLKTKWAMFFAFGFLLWIAYLQLLDLFGIPLPSPGKAIVLLTLAAGIMSLQPDMHWYHRVAWVVILAAFGLMELKSIDQDRREHEIEFNAIASGMQNVTTASDRNFRETMAGIRATLEATDQTLQNTAPKALLAFEVAQVKLSGSSCAQDPCRLLELKPGEEIKWTIQFRNSGNQDATDTRAGARQFVGMPADIKFQTQSLRTFEEGLKGPNVLLHINTPILPSPEIHHFSIHPTFEPLDLEQMRHGATVYIFSRLIYRDLNGEWETDRCEYVRNIKEYPLQTTQPCLLNNAARKFRRH